jgi:hypothetical protein
VALRSIRDSSACSIGDLNAGICETSHLGYSDQQQDKNRQYKGEFYKSLADILA